jgi:hypothetical protein
MELFIRMENGKPVDHPIMGQNFKEAFPDIDTKNLPPEFAKFIRVPQPTIGPYQIYEGVTYEMFGDICMDVHHIKQMNIQQMIDKQNLIKDRWAAGGWVSWIFNEDTCSFSAPVPYPEDGKLYRWDEPTVSWVEVV